MSHESDVDAIFVSFPSNSIEDREAREELFVGDIAEWAKKRAKRLGDWIVAKHMYIEWDGSDRHNAAWIEHSGINPDTGEHYHIHHLACDCFRSQDPVIAESDPSEFECSVLENALIERAQKIDTDYKIRTTLKSLEGLEVPDDKKPDIYHDMVLSVIEETLREDHLHPDHWVANIVTGQHRATLMSHILQMPVEAVRLYADILKLNDKIEFDGEVIKLKEAA